MSHLSCHAIATKKEEITRTRRVVTQIHGNIFRNTDSPRDDSRVRLSNSFDLIEGCAALSHLGYKGVILGQPGEAPVPISANAAIPNVSDGYPTLEHTEGTECCTLTFALGIGLALFEHFLVRTNDGRRK